MVQNRPNFKRFFFLCCSKLAPINFCISSGKLFSETKIDFGVVKIGFACTILNLLTLHARFFHLSLPSLPICRKRNHIKWFLFFIF